MEKDKVLVVIMISIFPIIMYLFINFYYCDNIKYFYKYKLWIPKAKDEIIVFYDEDNIDNKYNKFSILEYDKEKFEDVLRKNNVQKILDYNKVKTILENNIEPYLYDAINNTRNHRLWLYQEMFQMNLLNKNNYYLHIENDNYVCLMLFDTDQNKIYIFDNNYS